MANLVQKMVRQRPAFQGVTAHNYSEYLAELARQACVCAGATGAGFTVGMAPPPRVDWSDQWATGTAGQGDKDCSQRE
jgi:hypothetical protein